MTIKRPLLAFNGTPDLKLDIKYPVLLSPKLDGIRCIIADGHPISRTFKNIPNKYIYEVLSSYCLPDNLDGEILTYTNGQLDKYNDVQSKVMTQEGEPEFIYHIFDYCQSAHQAFAVRYYNLLTWYSEFINKFPEEYLIENPFKLAIVLQAECRDSREIESNETYWLAQGMEGVMLRSPEGIYKFGRSTLREQILLKLKRFSDSEATIIGMKELMRNDNEQQADAFGLAKRSAHQDNQYGADIMGAITVKDIHHPEWPAFDIGTGFTDRDRKYFWKNRELIFAGAIPNIIKYKYQAHGMKDVPRCPVYLGMRNLKLDGTL